MDSHVSTVCALCPAHLMAHGQHLEQDNVTVKISNCNPEVRPSRISFTGFKSSDLWVLLERLSSAGHRVVRIAYQGDTADIVCNCSSDAWYWSIQDPD